MPYMIFKINYFLRAASQENDSIEGHTGRPVMRINRNGGSLYKKSLSLDQSLQIEQQGVSYENNLHIYN